MKPNLLLDSGAYSAWFKGTEIDIDAYIDFIKAHGQHFCSSVCLDTIPGGSGFSGKTKDAYELAAVQSHKNFTYMRKAGVESIPVFHQGEDWFHLERMLDERVPYIGISPITKAHHKSIEHWMDQCFSRLTTADGIPLCKTHGFGVMGHRLVRRYPWYSVDGTSWALSAGYGNIFLPGLTGDAADFTRPSQHELSERPATANSLVHANDPTRRLIDAYFAELGTTFTEVRNFQDARLLVNATYYLGLQKQLTAEPFKFRLRGLPARKLKHRAVEFDWTPRIFFATMMRTTQGDVLNRLGAQDRLLSYYDCRKSSHDDIETYAAEGHHLRPHREHRIGSKSYELRRRYHFLRRLARLELESN